MDRLEMNISKVNIISETLAHLHKEDKATQELMLRVTMASLEAIWEEEDIKIPYNVYAEEVFVLESTAISTLVMKGGKAVIRGVYKVVKAIYNAIVLSTTTLIGLMVKLHDRIITFFSGRRKLLNDIARWYNTPANGNLLTGTVKTAYNSVHNVSGFASHGTVLKFLELSIEQGLDIGDKKAIEYYVRKSDVPGKWTSKVRGWYVGDKKPTDFKTAVEGNLEILKESDKDLSRFMSLMVQVNMIEKKYIAELKKTEKKYSKDNSKESAEIVKSFGSTTMIDMKKEVSELISRYGEFHVGNITQEPSPRFESGKVKSEKFIKPMRHDDPAVIMSGIQEVFTSIFKKNKKLSKVIKKRKMGKWQVSKVINSPKIVKTLAEIARDMITYFNIIIKVLSITWKAMGSLFFSVVDSVVASTTYYRQKERDLLTIKAMKSLRAILRKH